MTGIIPIYKPEGRTSNSITLTVRQVTGEKKTGHAGTLDPMATGVLPILLGSATKLADLLPGDKTYRVSFKTGQATDTGDRTGSVLWTSGKSADPREVEAAALSFQGRIIQTPPMFSAVKKDGQPLYRLARQGIEIERAPRAVTIYSISGFEYCPQTSEYHMTVHCSKGTYIRTLCTDIGEKLGTGAVMTGLCRTAACGIPAERCVTPDELARLASEHAVRQCMLDAPELFRHCPEVHIDPSGETYYLNGGVIEERRLSCPLQDGLYRVYSQHGIFLGLGSLFHGETEGLKSVWSARM